MATENRNRFNETYTPGLFAMARQNWKAIPEAWREYYSVKNSGNAYERSAYMSGYSYLPEKPEGTPVTTDARIQGPAKEWWHTPYGLKSIVTHEAIEDDLYGVMKMATADMVKSAKATAHLLATRLIMNATNTTYHTCGDALAVASNSHVQLGGGTWDNLNAAAFPNATSLSAAIENFEAYTDRRGLKYDQKAQGVVCGPGLEFEFMKLLEMDFQATNTDDTAPYRKRNLKIIVDNEITDNRWMVIGPKDDEVGLIWYWREKPRLSKHGDPDTGDNWFIIYMRCSNEVNEPRQLYFVPAFT